MADHPTLISILEITGILGSALAAGFNISTTYLTIPIIITPAPGLKPHASTLALQWKTLYDRGKIAVIPLGMGSAASFALRALLEFKNPSTGPNVASKDSIGSLFVVAAILAVSFAPYTQIIMGGVNEALWQRAIVAAASSGTSDEQKDENTVQELIQRWSRLNLFRGIILLGAAVVGSWASFAAAV
ncbi:hypothetical protein Plec18167_003777 [Paecilomyces lecythidis]|uniref:DUF1772-domain-containing protein n=1 Tax=Paecilomyces lecythidis TaxID=3004212 RepID=A0ABR3XWI3_9EURO